MKTISWFSDCPFTTWRRLIVGRTMLFLKVELVFSNNTISGIGTTRFLKFIAW